MTLQRIYEGTLDEIVRLHGSRIAGHRVRVIIQEPATNNEERPLYETATPEELAAAWRDWAASHGPNTPCLSDEAVSRDSIYEGRG